MTKKEYHEIKSEEVGVVPTWCGNLEYEKEIN